MTDHLSIPGRSSDGRRPCAIPGCSSYVDPEFLMCKRHWAIVPRRLKGRVTTTWRRLRQGGSMQEYADARHEAIEYVCQDLKILNRDLFEQRGGAG